MIEAIRHRVKLPCQKQNTSWIHIIHTGKQALSVFFKGQICCCSLMNAYLFFQMERFQQKHVLASSNRRRSDTAPCSTPHVPKIQEGKQGKTKLWSTHFPKIRDLSSNTSTTLYLRSISVSNQRYVVKHALLHTFHKKKKHTYLKLHCNRRCKEQRLLAQSWAFSY